MKKTDAMPVPKKEEVVASCKNFRLTVMSYYLKENNKKVLAMVKTGGKIDSLINSCNGSFKKIFTDDDFQKLVLENGKLFKNKKVLDYLHKGIIKAGCPFIDLGGISTAVLKNVYFRSVSCPEGLDFIRFQIEGELLGRKELFLNGNILN